MNTSKPHEVTLISLAVLAALGLYGLAWWPFSHPRSSDDSGRRWFWCTLAFGAVFTVCCYLGVRGGSFLNDKYATFLSAVWCVGVAMALGQTTRRTGNVVVIVLVLANSAYSIHAAINRKTEEWSEAANYVSRRLDEGDCVVVVASFCKRNYQYYATRSDTAVIGLPGEVRAANDVVDGPGQLVVREGDLRAIRRTLSNYSRVWMIWSHETRGEVKRGEVLERFFEDEGFDVLSEREFYKIRVQLLQRSDDSSDRGT